jgi:hypothetical protein
LNWGAAALVGAALLVGFAVHESRIVWDGATNPEVVWLVTDESGRPIENAVVELKPGEFGSWEFCEAESILLRTDAGGRAHRLAANCSTSGEYRRLEIFGIDCGCTRDTFHLRPPSWRFCVLANGYDACEWIDMEWSEYSRQVERGQEVATLTVRVSLRKHHD